MLSYLFLFLVMSVGMLARDTLGSLSTTFIAKEHWLRAAVFNSLGDGCDYALVYLVATVAIQASTSTTVAQIAGQMAGAFAGVLGGKLVSLLLDHNVSWYTARSMLRW